MTAKIPAPVPAPKAPRTRERDPRLPAVGTTLTRVYKGREPKISVLEDSFKFEGETYSSLSALAAKATGQASINGFLWMKLTKRPATSKPESAERTAAPEKARAPKARRAGRDPSASRRRTPRPRTLRRGRRPPPDAFDLKEHARGQGIRPLSFAHRAVAVLVARLCRSWRTCRCRR